MLSPRNMIVVLVAAIIVMAGVVSMNVKRNAPEPTPAELNNVEPGVEQVAPTTPPADVVNVVCLNSNDLIKFLQEGEYTRLSASALVLNQDNPTDPNTNAVLMTFVNKEKLSVSVIVKPTQPDRPCVLQGYGFVVDDWSGLFEQTPATKDPI